MLAWERSFGDNQRVGIECSGSYGGGVLDYMQAECVEILEVTAPDKLNRHSRGNNDEFDAESADYAAFARRYTVTSRSMDGMVESLRVLRIDCKTAIQARRIALQLIQMTIICAPEKIHDPLRNMTRMQLIRALAAARLDLTAYRQVEEAYRISLKSLARRYLELDDEIADLDDMLEAIVNEFAPELFAQTAIGVTSAIHIIAMGRLRLEASTQAYVARRVAAGNSRGNSLPQTLTSPRSLRHPHAAA